MDYYIPSLGTLLTVYENFLKKSQSKILFLVAISATETLVELNKCNPHFKQQWNRFNIYKPILLKSGWKIQITYSPSVNFDFKKLSKPVGKYVL